MQLLALPPCCGHRSPPWAKEWSGSKGRGRRLVGVGRSLRRNSTDTGNDWAPGGDASGRSVQDCEECGMIIEFAIVGDGTNIEVLLIDRLDAGEPPAEAVVDHIYTADHKGGIHYGDDQKVPASARQLFEWAEDSWHPPT